MITLLSFIFIWYRKVVLVICCEFTKIYFLVHIVIKKSSTETGKYGVFQKNEISAVVPAFRNSIYDKYRDIVLTELCYLRKNTPFFHLYVRILWSTYFTSEKVHG